MKVKLSLSDSENNLDDADNHPAKQITIYPSRVKMAKTVTHHVDFATGSLAESLAMGGVAYVLSTPHHSGSETPKFLKALQYAFQQNRVLLDKAFEAVAEDVEQQMKG